VKLCRENPVCSAEGPLTEILPVVYRNGMGDWLLTATAWSSSWKPMRSIHPIVFTTKPDALASCATTEVIFVSAEAH
jgi:hypothetical protein